LSLQPRPQLKNLEACTHGGLYYSELKAAGINPESVLDFSVCTNPFLPDLDMQRVLSEVAIDKYPDSEATELTKRLAEKLDLSSRNILVGSGTTELIQLVALAYFRQDDEVLILEPTYGEYQRACEIAGAKPVKQWSIGEDSFETDIEEVNAVIKDIQPRCVFICNPNNPTGQYLSREQIEAVLSVIGDGLLVLDEAYVSFLEESWSSIELISRGNVVVLRSMTKDYGLAGLRLGYAAACQEIIDNLRRVVLPWNVNAIAQKVGTIVLDNEEYLEQSMKKIREAKQYLAGELLNLGFQIVPSGTNYFLVKVGNAGKFRADLLKCGILVRGCDSFGLPEYVRIAARTMPECRKLVLSIRDVMKEGGLDIA